MTTKQLSYMELVDDAIKNTKSRMVMSWPINITPETIHQLETVFTGGEYWVPQTMQPMHVCGCGLNCPTIKVNITECRNFGIIPVALCNFHGWSNNNKIKVKKILETVCNVSYEKNNNTTCHQYY